MSNAPVMCKAGQAYQHVVLGDGTAAIRDRKGNLLGYVEASDYYPKGFHGWTCRLEEDREFPFRLNGTCDVPIKAWRTDELKQRGLALADFELARKTAVT